MPEASILTRHHDRDAGDEAADGSGHSSSPDVGPADVEIDHEDAPLILEDEHVSEQNTETGSEHPDQYHREQDVSLRLEASPDVDETSSTPDDGPSIQVTFILSTSNTR